MFCLSSFSWPFARVNNYFVTNHRIHGHLTRQHNDMHQLLYYSNVRAASIKIYGVKIWNLIPDTIRTLPSIYLRVINYPYCMNIYIYIYIYLIILLTVNL